jgi:hypothetical protein
MKHLGTFDDSSKLAATRVRELCYSIDPPHDLHDVESALTVELSQAKSSLHASMTYLSQKSTKRSLAAEELTDVAAHAIRASHYVRFLDQMDR